MPLYKTSSESGTLPAEKAFDQSIIFYLGRRDHLLQLVNELRQQSIPTIVIPLNERLGGFNDALGWRHLLENEKDALRNITHLSQICILGFSNGIDMQIWGSFLEGASIFWIEHFAQLIEEAAPQLKEPSSRRLQIKVSVDNLNPNFCDALCHDLWSRNIRARIVGEQMPDTFINKNGDLTKKVKPRVLLNR